MAVVYLNNKGARPNDVSNLRGGVEGTRGVAGVAGASPLVNKEQVFRFPTTGEDDERGAGASVSYSDKYALAAKARYVFRRCLEPHEVCDEDGTVREKMPSVALCCTARPDVHGVTVYGDRDHKGHGIGHVVHCSSLWVCPVCAPYIASGRGLEIKESLDKSRERGYGVEFITLTVRHSRDDDLGHLLGLLQQAWKSVMTCRRMRTFKEKHGFLAYVRRTEVTYSLRSGFHPHFHALFYFDHALTDQEHAEFSSLIALLWERFLIKHEGDGADRTLNAHGYQVDRVDLTDEGQVKVASYISKICSVGGLALEMSDGGEKEGREDGSFSMFQVLRLIDIDRDGWQQSWQCRVWLDYYYATKGKKVFHYSADRKKDGELVHAGFKTLFGVEEKEDEEVAEEQSAEYHKESEVIGILSRDAWKSVTWMSVRDQGRFNDDLRRDDVSRFGEYGLRALPVSVRDKTGGLIDRTSWGVPLWIGVDEGFFTLSDDRRSRVLYVLRLELADAMGLGVSDIDVSFSVVDDDGDGCPEIDDACCT